jgi:hypothetical protein
LRCHRTPRVGTKRNDEVRATRRNFRRSQPLERRNRLRWRHVLEQVELEEMMGVRALRENPELR